MYEILFYYLNEMRLMQGLENCKYSACRGGLDHSRRHNERQRDRQTDGQGDRWKTLHYT